MAVQEAMAKGTSAITSNANLVKQVFPVEVLPVKIALAASISQLIYTAILIVYTLARYGFLHWTVCLTPILLILQFVGSVGLCYILSSLAVHFRDMKDFVQVFCVAGMYVLPVCYLPQWVPSAFQPLLAFNPFSHMAWCWQDCLYFGRFEHPVAWIVFPLGSLAMCCIGYRLFRKLKVCFGSLL
jgi:lipopolysaccharide transport system permease protein